MKKTHDYIHHYRGYWSDGGKCRIRIYREDRQAPVVVCSQLPDNDNTSVTNMAEYLTGGGNRRIQPAYAADLDRALFRARRRDRGVLVGEVL